VNFGPLSHTIAFGSPGAQPPAVVQRNAELGASFIRSTLKRSHLLWVAVTAAEKRWAPKKEKHNPLAVAQMRNLFPNPDADYLDRIAWAHDHDRMGAKELYVLGKVLADRVHIIGTKTAHRTNDSRVRDVPLIRIPTRPKFNRRKFEDDLRVRAGGAFTVRDLRRTYAHWMEAARIVRARREMYMGHSHGNITGLYEQHDLAAFLAEDAAKLRTYIGLPPIKPQLVRDTARPA
jgi:integrase